jgi:hypothetical protein
VLTLQPISSQGRLRQPQVPPHQEMQPAGHSEHQNSNQGIRHTDPMYALCILLVYTVDI